MLLIGIQQLPWIGWEKNWATIHSFWTGFESSLGWTFFLDLVTLTVMLASDAKKWTRTHLDEGMYYMQLCTMLPFKSLGLTPF